MEERNPIDPVIEAMIEPVVELLSRDVREAAKKLSILEVRYLVRLYYQIQDFRIASAAQVRELVKVREPCRVLSWAADGMDRIEREIRKWMDVYTDAEATGMGAWAKQIVGIGPVLSAGLVAHIDIKKAPTAGHIWSFAGLVPGKKWEKGKKRPFNADLKKLCYKISDSFVKFQNHLRDTYGKLYVQRKAYEIGRNERGELLDQAKIQLESGKRWRKETEAYKHYIQGKLPDAHIHARACRWTVKLFLAHYQAEAYRRHYGKEPPKPYAIQVLGHAHEI